MDSQQAGFSLPTAPVGQSPRSLDADSRWLGALKRRPPRRKPGIFEFGSSPKIIPVCTGVYAVTQSSLYSNNGTKW
jgi:hypothetical protein